MKLMFLNGPAKGVQLHADRAPPFLRVGQSLEGDWRALAALDDEPLEAERLVAYRKCSGGEFVACYRECEWQPGRAEIASRNAWREWTSNQVWPY